MKRSFAVFLYSVLSLFLAVSPSHGQGTTFAAALGVTPGGTYSLPSTGGGPIDVINLGNLNAHITIPIIQKPGRGAPYSYNVTYDSSIWYPVGSSGTQTWVPQINYGWNFAVPNYAAHIISTYGNVINTY